MNKNPLLIQEMIANGYRAVEIRLPGFDRVIDEVAEQCETIIDVLLQPATNLAIEALRVFFPGADFEIDDVSKEETYTDWPRGILVERHVYAHGGGVGNRRPYARIRLRHAILNPHDGEGYSLYINLWSITKPHYEKAMLRVANQCGKPASIHISGTYLTNPELDGLIAATGTAFNCTPSEEKRIE